jgi:molecular chaperone GrpE (heat shock protein)
VRDSLEAAIAIQAATPEQLLEGVHATLRQLTQALERNKVVAIAPPAGTKFDPHQHQAISVVPAEQDANTVVMPCCRRATSSPIGCCARHSSRWPRPSRARIRAP